MPFIILPNNNGKIYDPKHDSAPPRKHHCENCFSCQVCSDDRCRLCLNSNRCDLCGANHSEDGCLE